MPTTMPRYRSSAREHHPSVARPAKLPQLPPREGSWNHRHSSYSPAAGHLPPSSFTGCPPAPSTPPQRPPMPRPPFRTASCRRPPSDAAPHRRSPPAELRPVETAPLVSPPLRCASSRFRTTPCSPSTPPWPTLPLVATGIVRPPPP
jgi:hypothetical protein